MVPVEFVQRGGYFDLIEDCARAASNGGVRTFIEPSTHHSRPSKVDNLQKELASLKHRSANMLKTLCLSSVPQLNALSVVANYSLVLKLP